MPGIMRGKWTHYTLFATIGRMSDATDYLRRIRDASVYDVAIRSPLEAARNLSSRLGNSVWLKREDLQPVFSFKLRGATNKLASLSPADLANGVICSSAGNHAQGVALAAKRRDVKAVIVMPITTPSIKVDAVRALGGDVVLIHAEPGEGVAHRGAGDDQAQARIPGHRHLWPGIGPGHGRRAPQ